MNVIALPSSTGANTVFRRALSASVAPLRLARTDAFDEPLAQFAAEISCELRGDGLLVTWHDGNDDPLILFADGDCTPQSNEERVMATVSCAASCQPGASTQAGWRIDDDNGFGEMLTTSIPTPVGFVTITTLFKRIGQTTQQRVSETAARLLPLVQPFFRMWGLRRYTMGHAAALTSALNNTDIGIILVDSAGQVTFANDVAETLLARNDGLRRKGKSLFGARLADTLRLQAALEHAIAPHSDEIGRPVAPVVPLQRAKGRPLLAAIVASGKLFEIQQSGATIFVVDPDQDLRQVAEPACGYYRLTPVETRLTCMLVNGISIAGSAEAMHVTEQTARSYLKQIFMKTETNRQAELIHLMLTSSVRTAPANCVAFQ